VIVCVAIAAVTVGWRLRLDPVLAFWIAYILTRPLGASLGDYLSQTAANGGLGLGAQATTIAFLATIILTVGYLTITRKDRITTTSQPVTAKGTPYAVAWQVAVVLTVLLLAAGSGYHWRSAHLREEAKASASSTAPLGHLDHFRRIAEDTLVLVQAGNLADAKTRIGDLEFAWDEAEAKLRTMNPEKWTTVDDSIDDVLRKLRSVKQDGAACRTALQSLIGVLNSLDGAAQATASPPQAR